MEKKNVLTKILAIAGLILVWFPLLTPLLISVLFFLQEQTWRLDYLMPMELFLFSLVGSGMLFWATLRAHAHIKYIAGGTGLALFMFFGVQWFAVVTGLASGATQPEGWVWYIVILSIVLYTLGILLVGVGGALFVRDLFKTQLPAP